MTQPDFYTILENEALLKEVQISELDEMIAAYPYSASLFVLKARALHEQQHEEFQLSLEKAAARTISRTKLHELIEGKPVLDFEWMEVPDTESIITEMIDDSEEKALQNEEIDNYIEDSTIENDPISFPREIENYEIVKGDLFSKIEPENNKSEVLDLVDVTTNIIITIKELNEPEVIKFIPGKNDFTFSFVRVSNKISDQKEIHLIPSQFYDINQINRGKISKTRKNEDTIIEKFLEYSPSITLPTIDFGPTKTITDLAADSAKLTEEIITENMAMIYLKQKNYSKALDIYRKLKLKNPEKCDYFAALIKNLENKIV